MGQLCLDQIDEFNPAPLVRDQQSLAGGEALDALGQACGEIVEVVIVFFLDRAVQDCAQDSNADSDTDVHSGIAAITVAAVPSHMING